MIVAATVRTTSQLVSLRWLRAIAALIVVGYHACGDGRDRSAFAVGASGVDIFFVVSGFVMVWSAGPEALGIRSVGGFVRRRLWRIVPLYWLALGLLMAVRLARGDAFGAAEWAETARSYLFVPQFSLREPTRIQPILVAGWTLTFEIAFYLLFAIGLALRRPLVVATTAIALLIAAGFMFAPAGAVGRTYTDPLLAEFAIGMAVAGLTRRGYPGRWRAGWWCLPLGVTVLLTLDHHPVPRLFGWGVAAGLIVAGTVALEDRIRALPPRWLGAVGALGDASYAIYLFQLIPLGAGAAAVAAGILPRAAAPAVMIVAAALVGMAIHYAVKRPILAWSRGPIIAPPDRR